MGSKSRAKCRKRKFGSVSPMHKKRRKISIESSQSVRVSIIFIESIHCESDLYDRGSIPSKEKILENDANRSVLLEISDSNLTILNDNDITNHTFDQGTVKVAKHSSQTWS